MFLFECRCISLIIKPVLSQELEVALCVTTGALLNCNCPPAETPNVFPPIYIVPAETYKSFHCCDGEPSEKVLFLDGSNEPLTLKLPGENTPCVIWLAL